ncbi:clostripain-related cysteine peptidase [Candidatus Lokiarchaeum ossiferum]|uniref:clostripain-related cysteine peptidase n=1 Tax=Candidatus Lokiarchaeum ossiferum TaxID=2951803 RepID=UPI00352D0C02
MVKLRIKQDSFFQGLVIWWVFFSFFWLPLSFTPFIESKNFVPKISLDESKTSDIFPKTSQEGNFVPWTIMIYMSADNNLEAAALNDLNEMEIIGSTEGVNIVVQIDRHSGFSTTNGDWDECRRYLINQDLDTTKITSSFTSLGEINMGNAQSLESFCNYSMESYPAENYALILWDHGSGPIFQSQLGGVCFDRDSISDPWDYLTSLEIAKVLEKYPVDLLGFDACYMASTEIYHDFSSFVKIIVASEVAVPSSGWPYDAILLDMVMNPFVNAKKVGRIIVNNYVDSVKSLEITGIQTEISAINMEMWGPFKDSCNEFLKQIQNTLDSALMTLVEQALYYSYIGTSPYFDSRCFFQYLNDHNSDLLGISNVLDIQSHLVLESYATSYGFNFTGISLYFPKSISDFCTAYFDFSFCQDFLWDDFLRVFYDFPEGKDHLEPNNDIGSAFPIKNCKYDGLILEGIDWYAINLRENVSASLIINFEESLHQIQGDVLIENFERDILMLVPFNNQQIVNISIHNHEESKIYICLNSSTFNTIYYYSMSISLVLPEDFFESNDNLIDGSILEFRNSTQIENLTLLNPDWYIIDIPSNIWQCEVELETEITDHQVILESWQKYNENSNSWKFSSSATNFSSKIHLVEKIYELPTAIAFHIESEDSYSFYNLTISFFQLTDDHYDYTGGGNDHHTIPSRLNSSINEVLWALDPDWYQLKATDLTWFNITVKWDVSIYNAMDLSIYLFESNLDQECLYPIAESIYNINGESIVFQLNPASDYLLLVNGTNLGEEYNLIISNSSSFCQDCFDETNNWWNPIFDQHFDFPLFKLGDSFSNLSGWDVDWFSINLEAGVPAIISMKWAKGKFRMEVYESNQNLLLWKKSYVNSLNLRFIPQNGGKYYMKIIPLLLCPNYSLNIIEEKIFSPSFSILYSDSLDIKISPWEYGWIDDLIKSFFINYGDNTSEQSEEGYFYHMYNKVGRYSVIYVVQTIYGTIYSLRKNIQIGQKPRPFLIRSTFSLESWNQNKNTTFLIEWESDVFVDTYELTCFANTMDFVIFNDFFENVKTIHTHQITILYSNLPQNQNISIIVEGKNNLGFAKSQELKLVEIQHFRRDMIYGLPVFILLAGCLGGIVIGKVANRGKVIHS